MSSDLNLDDLSNLGKRKYDRTRAHAPITWECFETNKLKKIDDWRIEEVKKDTI